MEKHPLASNFFPPNHTDFDYNQYPLGLGTFWMYPKRKQVNALNLEKKIRNEKKCARGALILFLIFQIQNFYFFTLE